MGWEKRSGGKMYFYRSLRRGSRIVRRYFGRGPAAEYAAEILDLQREEQLEERKRKKAIQQAYSAVADAAGDYLDSSQLLLRACLLAAGLYRHDRGSWRTRRE